VKEGFTIAVAGDSIINRRVSVFSEERFLSMVKVIRDADLAYTHLETLIHDYEGPETFPAAEGGWAWMRSPRYVADELKWMGFDLVTLASNHTLDYSYGGLYSTWKALEQAGLPHAGTGKNLGEARAPVYIETPKGRAALISMCSSFTAWSRAGEARPDVGGRPGLNPLRFHYVVDADLLETIKHLSIKLGWWVRNVGDAWLMHPAGLHHAILKFVKGNQPGISTAVDEEDAEGNLRSIRDARRRVDWVLVHLHTHEWDPDHGLSVPAKFAIEFARACIDAGADLFIGGGSHSFLRGIELYKGKPVLYDPGDFMAMVETITRLPADFYLSPGLSQEVRNSRATPADGLAARKALPMALSPAGGYHTAKVLGSVIALCSFGEGGGLNGIKIYPVVMTGKPASQSGRPMLANAEMGRKIIEYLAELSAPFGTKIEFEDGVGVVRL
jgi:poly-gamma-glutamate capsule biosynthesis protein CapA/YwtB (metallophosphatase superfamily)